MAHATLSQKKNNFEKHQNPIIKGEFPTHPTIYKKPAIVKANKILAFSLLAAVIVSMTSYIGVIAKENKIKNLHASTNKINYENIELQNKVDYLKSFYTIDTKVQKIDFLKKADQVLEVRASNKIPIISSNKKKNDIFSVPGF